MVTSGIRAVGSSATMTNGVTRQGGTRAGLNAGMVVLALKVNTAHLDNAAKVTFVARSK
jgi:hypothetical protein